MSTPSELSHNSERALLYHWLSLVFQFPFPERWTQLSDYGLLECCREAADVLCASSASNDNKLAHGEVPITLLTLNSCASRLPDNREELVKQFDALFGLLVSRDCPPYETEYCPQTFSVYRSQQLADIVGFYRAFGVEPSPTQPERADHISCELEFMSWLILKEEYARESVDPERMTLCWEAQHRFHSEHLLWWAPAFAFALRRQVDGISDESALQHAPTTFYGAAGQLLAAFLRSERLRFDIEPPKQLVDPQFSTADPEVDICEGCDLATS